MLTSTRLPDTLSGARGRSAEEKEALRALPAKSRAAKKTSEDESPEVSTPTLRFYIHVHDTALSCLQLDDDYLEPADELIPVPFQPMEEYMDEIHEHVMKNGPFYRNTYDDYLAQKIGEVDCDGLEW